MHYARGCNGSGPGKAAAEAHNARADVLAQPPAAPVDIVLAKPERWTLRSSRRAPLEQARMAKNEGRSRLTCTSESSRSAKLSWSRPTSRGGNGHSKGDRSHLARLLPCEDDGGGSVCDTACARTVAGREGCVNLTSPGAFFQSRAEMLHKSWDFATSSSGARHSAEGPQPFVPTAMAAKGKQWPR